MIILFVTALLIPCVLNNVEVSRPGATAILVPSAESVHSNAVRHFRLMSHVKLLRFILTSRHCILLTNLSRGKHYSYMHSDKLLQTITQ
uniref:Secreted protein n=1 Tax=Syphacia muris TaxID=451379 RepID=A0A0N5AA33_9BILA